MTFDNVNKPKHCNSHPSGIEARVINTFLNGPLAAAFKYVFRAELKHAFPIEDYKKAEWYVKESRRRCAPLSIESVFKDKDDGLDQFRYHLDEIWYAETCPVRGQVLDNIAYVGFLENEKDREQAYDTILLLLKKLIEKAETHKRCAEALATTLRGGDDVALQKFAVAMSAKLAKKRAEGKHGWNDKAACSHEYLSELLHDLVEKGDPVDVANLCMMLWSRGEHIIDKPVHCTETADLLGEMI